MASLVEYVLLIVLIAVVCVTAIALLGESAKNAFNNAVCGLKTPGDIMCKECADFVCGSHCGSNDRTVIYNPLTSKCECHCTVIGGVCTMDAMRCPDGSYVGRIPPNCEFAVCPTTTTTIVRG